MTKTGAIVVSVGLLLAGSRASAQSRRHIALGADASADRRVAFCGRVRCFDWALTGFGITGLRGGRMSDVARTRTGRFVAATPAGIQYTDDRGATWRDARGIEGAVFAVAFDATSDFGVAVGGSGLVWTSSDAGLSWRTVRDDTGVMLVRVSVVGRVVVTASSAGAAWMSTDGGFTTRALIDAPATTPNDERAIETRGDRIWIQRDDGSWIYVTVDGAVETAQQP